MKDIVILGGPNGAGKTTAAQVIVPEELGVQEFVNADEIARGLSPFNVQGVELTAGRLMIERIRTLVRGGKSFAFETTCAGRQHVRWLGVCKEDGWRITLLYLWLPNVEMAHERVLHRVAQGGHSIPPDVIERRYVAGIRNMRDLYLPLADIAAIYDNSNVARTLIAERTWKSDFKVHDADRWRMIEETNA